VTPSRGGKRYGFSRLGVGRRAKAEEKSKDPRETEVEGERKSFVGKKKKTKQTKKKKKKKKKKRKILNVKEAGLGVINQKEKVKSGRTGAHQKRKTKVPEKRGGFWYPTSTHGGGPLNVSNQN